MIPAGSIVLLLAGGALLVLIAPHFNPWDMTLLRTLPETGRVRLALGRVPLEFNPLVLYVALSALIGLLCASSRSGRAWLRSFGDGRRCWIALTSLAFLIFTLVPSEKGSELVLNLVLGLLGVALATVGAAILLPGLARGAERLLRLALARLEALPRPLFLALVFGVTFGLANLGSLFLFGHIPHIVDAVAQLFHAKMFAMGRLFVPSPDVREFFSFTHMIDNGRWYSQYPPGHTLLLAAGHLVGAPWLVNPLLGALSVVLLHPLGKAMFDERTGRLAAVLGAFCPFLLLMSSSFMSHTTTLFCLELFLLGLVRLLDGGRLRDGVLAGGGLGLAVNIRPMSAVAFAAPFLLYGVVRSASRGVGREGRTGLVRFCLPCLVAVLSCGLLIGGLLAYNQATNGDPLLFGYEVLHGRKSLPGFGNTGWWKTPHTAGRGLTWTLENFNALNHYLLGLPLPALLFAVSGFAARRPRVWDVLLAGSVVSLALAYFFYWYHDWALGPRFLYEATGPLLLLTARGLLSLPVFLRSLLPLGSVALALLLAFGYGLAVNARVLTAFYSRNYADGNPDVVKGIDGHVPPGSIVFAAPPYYSSVFPLNDPLLRGPVIYAQDHGLDKSLELMRRFPERRPFRLVAGEDYRLVPYTSETFSEPLTYDLVSGSPLTVELTTSQASFFSGGYWRDQATGELGGGWKHHDQLLITARAPGAQVGLLIRAREPERRSVLLGLARGPDFGIVEIRAGGSTRTLDLYAEDLRPERVLLEDVEFRPGMNPLSIAIVGPNERSKAQGMGVDYVSIR